MYGKWNNELECTPSGSGYSGGKLQKNGTLTLTFSTNQEYIHFERKLLAIDWNGKELSPVLAPNIAGGNWSNASETVQTGYGSPQSVAINMATFRSAYASHGNNLGGLRISVFISYSSGNYIGGDEYDFYFEQITNAKEPTAPTLTENMSRDDVELSWGAGSEGTNNSVTGYDVQYRESSDGSSWGSWTTASGSPVTGTKLSVAPSGTVGNYRQYRVRTRGSAGSDYYSGWVVSTNTLRRKWDAFGAWTDPTLTAGVSGIRAVHLTQLQERVAVIRAFYGMAAYSFTAVTARKTKIAKWAALIGEIRTAIDQITTGHEAWNTLEAGKPRIAHITQLRRIIDNL